MRAVYVGKSHNNDLSHGKSYSVHAISVWRGVSHLQVVSDYDTIAWVTANFFQVVDGSIPEDWVVLLPETSELVLVVGPKFLAGSVDCYNNMVNQDPESVRNFWLRVRDRRTDDNIDGQE